jgi:hypothetical protein
MEKKSFWSENKQAMKKLWATHFVMCIFGLMTYLPFNTKIDENGNKPAGWWLALFACIIAILFMWYIIDLFIWEVGAKDQIRGQEANTMNGFKGFVLGLIVAIPDFILGALYTFFWYYQEYIWAKNPAFIISLITGTWESMFMGIKATLLDNGFPFYFLITPFIPVIFTGISYLLGTKEKSFIPRPKRKAD